MNKIQLNKDSIVYVVCQSYFKTGGTELLHQLVYMLNKEGYNAKMCYYDATEEKNINPAYKGYISEYYNMEDIVDDKNNVVILSETYTLYLNYFKNIRKCIWWLSVDNYRIHTIKYYLENKNYFTALKKIIKHILRKDEAVSMKALKSVDYHLVQSEYASDYLKQYNIDSLYLSDYINDVYVERSKNIDYSKKENIVCYNPKKGYKFTKSIIDASKNIKYIPLINMTNDEVSNTLLKSKVYIDFGNHPGKDRFPREAAVMGCCIITGKKGSAKFYQDVRIKDDYKFLDKSKNINSIVKQIEYCLDNYDKVKDDYKEYIDMIVNEKDKFVQDILNVFEKC